MMNDTVVAIVQSCYIPWKGYFDLIKAADIFIVLDNVQYTRRDWRNRNKIKTRHGSQWLTIPVASKGSYLAAIDEIQIVQKNWVREHLATITHNYRSAVCFEAMFPELATLYYQAAKCQYLSHINTILIHGIMRLLAIDTRMYAARDIVSEPSGDASNRLACLVQAVGGTVYLSGPRGQNYLKTQPFMDRGVTLHYINYDNYPHYPQINGDFTHQVSIIDLLLNCGYDSEQYMKDLRFSVMTD